MKDFLLRTIFKPVSASTLSAARILISGLLFIEILHFWQIGFVPFGLTRPVFHLKYDYFEWVNPLPEPVMYGILALMTVCTLLMTAGFLFRIASAVFSLGLTYFMLIEQSHYNNHFYLFVLLTAVFACVDADKMYSVKSRRTPGDGMIPYWHHLLPLFLLCVTYFYGGIAKLSPEWISGRLPGSIVDNLTADNILISTMGREGATAFLQWGGVCFDLSIPFLLLWKKTRWPAVIAVLIFNFTNGNVLFADIGHFPLFMVLATALFFPPDFVKNLFAYGDKPKGTRRANGKKQRTSAKKNTPAAVATVKSPVWTSGKALTAGLLAAFVLIQLVLPLRHHFIGSPDPEWSGQFQRFSWRMKMQTKEVEKMDLMFVDLVTGEESPLPYQQHLTGHQLKHITTDPNYLPQLAKYFKGAIQNRDVSNAVIRGDVQIKYNGRAAQQYLNPSVDLSAIEPREGTTNWILPLKALK